MDFPITAQNRVRQVAKRGQYDRATIYAILDQCCVCHLGFVHEERPCVIPTLYGRVEDRLIVHGAPGSRMLRHIAAGHPVCVAVTLVDGLVVARSVFHHSMNYRSVVLFGSGQVIEDEAERLSALEALTEHILPGRWHEARVPNARELAATAVAAITIETASAKVRTGPPVDDEEDYALRIWAGVLPVRQVVGSPIPDERLAREVPLPASIQTAQRRSDEGARPDSIQG